MVWVVISEVPADLCPLALFQNDALTCAYIVTAISAQLAQAARLCRFLHAGEHILHEFLVSLCVHGFFDRVRPVAQQGGRV